MTIEKEQIPHNFRLTRIHGVFDKRASVIAAVNHTGAEQCGSYDLTDSVRWYCVCTHVNHEYTALSQLDRWGFILYLPLMLARIELLRKGRTRDGTRAGPCEVIDIVFPGYLFCAFDTRNEDWKTIHSAKGVRYLFGGERPTPVPPGVVEALIRQGDPRDGVLDPERLRPSAKRPVSGLQPGQRGAITAGPFSGMSGLCTMSDGDRVSLLVDVMRRQVPVMLGTRDVVAQTGT